MRRLLYFGLFISFLGAGSRIIQLSRYRDAILAICTLTEKHFYRDDQTLRQWASDCRKDARTLSLWSNAGIVAELVQRRMRDIPISHFNIYSPSEDRKLWKGESIDTGIRSRQIDDHLIVYRVIASSSAARAGVKAGDEVVRIPGSDQLTPWGCEHLSGEYLFRRRGRLIKLNLEPSELQIDSSPELRDLGHGVALLIVTSFRLEYFQREAWLERAQSLKRFKHVIIDLRENLGGNFVAMLRALSTFSCRREVIGHIVQPRKNASDLAELADKMEDAYQLQQLAQFRRIGLSTFANYDCFPKKVTVLIGSETSSVAEIFADAIKRRPNSRVWGQPSAGDVILAVWYDMPLLGEGYSFSIPEAIYQNKDGQTLESEGVFPQRELFYDLKSLLRGDDNWIHSAIHEI